MKTNNNNNDNNNKLKLIVQIPAYNEQETIGKVIREIPRKIQNIRKVEVLVINDGSRDKTEQEAREAGADYVIENKQNIGLARSFRKGVDFCLEKGADIIVNTDADLQYNQKEIPKLIQPILQGKADIVSGNRQIKKLRHMPRAKKIGNTLGSRVVSNLSGRYINDASSGFRAYSREAVLRLFVMSKHTYCHETLIQAANQNLKVIEVPVEFRKRNNGGSRLISSLPSHIKKSSSTIVRSTLMYSSLKTLGYIGIFLIIVGLVPMLRWVYLTYIAGVAGMHIQSLLLGLLLMMFGGLSILLGLIADLIAINRQYLEEILYRIKKRELGR